MTLTAQPRHRTLTPNMRDALRRARHQPLRRVHKTDEPGKPAWPAHASTLAALVRRDLMARTADISRRGYRMDVWTVTDAGREALEPPPKPPKPDRALLLTARHSRAPRYRTLPSGRQVAVGQGEPVRDIDERDPSGDYTSSSFRAMRREPESVDETTVLDFADDGRRRFARRRAQVRQDALAERVERAMQRARATGVDATGTAQAIDRMVTALERRAEDVA